jgi:hypothetical protein
MAFSERGIHIITEDITRKRNNRENEKELCNKYCILIASGNFTVKSTTEWNFPDEMSIIQIKAF